MVFGKDAPDDKIWYSISIGIYWDLCGSGVGERLIFRVDCSVIFVVDFSDLSGIRSFSKYLLRFFEGWEWGGVIWDSFIVFLGWSEWWVLCWFCWGLSEGECRMGMGIDIDFWCYE